MKTRHEAQAEIKSWLCSNRDRDDALGLAAEIILEAVEYMRTFRNLKWEEPIEPGERFYVLNHFNAWLDDGGADDFMNAPWRSEKWEVEDT